MYRILQKILDCFFLLRIPLLAPVWTILILGWIAGNGRARIGGFFTTGNNSTLHLWIILAGFSFIVASIYVVNQIVDIESDRINRKLFLLPHGFVSVRTAWVLASVCAFLGILCAMMYTKILLLLFLSGLALGALYNLPPARLKNRAWGGVAANAFGHGMITFLVGWYAARIGSTLDITSGLVSSIAPSLANAAVFLATTIPDSVGDRQTGKQTFCVKYGEKKTAIAAAFMCTGAFIFSFFIQYHAWAMILPAAVSLIFFIYLTIVTKRDGAFLSFKWPVFLLSAIVALFVPVYGALIFVTFFGSRAYYRWRFGIEYPTFKSK